LPAHEKNRRSVVIVPQIKHGCFGDGKNHSTNRSGCGINSIMCDPSDVTVYFTGLSMFYVGSLLLTYSLLLRELTNK
jgi:hypothetical protein